MNDSFDWRLGRSKIRATVTPWDVRAFGYRVASIEELLLSDPTTFRACLVAFMSWAHETDVKMASCRLPSESIIEGMLLEEADFRFIEMVLHPRFDLDLMAIPEVHLSVREVKSEDVEAVAKMAGTSFGLERFHRDPRVSSKDADSRYSNWILQGFDDESNSLLGVYGLANELLAFFLVDQTDLNTVNWRLTAVVPHERGRGIGHDAWLAVLGYHKEQGKSTVSTTISAHNTQVLNLYSKLSCRFDPPESTFHWFMETPHTDG